MNLLQQPLLFPGIDLTVGVIFKDYSVSFIFRFSFHLIELVV